MRIIDVHTHVYPDNIAEKASAGIGAFYDIPTRHNGTLSALLESGGECGVTGYVVHSVATKPEQAESINRFLRQICVLHPDRIHAFGAMHPGCSDPGKIVGQALEYGFHGIKLHPDIQGFSIDDPSAFAMYEAIDARLPVLMHTGDMRRTLSDPKRVLSVLKHFPRQRLICAHLGGWSQWDRAREYLAGKDIYVDTSSSLNFLSPDAAVKLIRAFGAERVLFGTDYPMWDAAEELERFMRLPLTSREQELILHENAEALLGI